MKREAFKMYLKPGFEKEYQKRHSEIWPELVKLLKANGVSDYSIFWDQETNVLYAVQKNDGAGSQDMGDNEIVKKWMDYMAGYHGSYRNSPVSIPLEEVFYME